MTTQIAPNPTGDGSDLKDTAFKREKSPEAINRQVIDLIMKTAEALGSGSSVLLKSDDWWSAPRQVLMVLEPVADLAESLTQMKRAIKLDEVQFRLETSEYTQEPMGLPRVTYNLYVEPRGSEGGKGQVFENVEQIRQKVDSIKS